MAGRWGWRRIWGRLRFEGKHFSARQGRRKDASLSGYLVSPEVCTLSRKHGAVTWSGREAMKKSPHVRSDLIHFEGMTHAPENELGVVFLFGKVHKRLGFTAIDEVKPGFPDCWAWRRTSKGTKRTWIEFEYRSSSFKSHVVGRQLTGLKPKKGFIVCWEHNWPGCEKYAEVIDLRAIAEQGPRVWIQSTLPQYQHEMDEIPYNFTKDWTWTVSPRAKKGDLLLLWRAGSRSKGRHWDVSTDLLQSFANIAEIVSTPRKKNSEFIRAAEIRRVATLENPLRWGALRADPVLRMAPFIRAQMQGQWDVTGYWWRLHSLLVQLNTSLKKERRFQKFDPHKLW